MVLAILACSALSQRPKTAPMEQLTLKAKTTIKKSSLVSPKVYRFANTWEDGKKAAIYVKGDNITVDFAGATLEGTPQTTEPNERVGTGLLISGKNVTVKNLKIRGYKFGVMAFNAPGLKLYNVDGSYNWKQRLLSTLDREDGADWMSYHQNEKNEWFRYGAAIYLRGCDGVEVKGCRAVGGQNGLMMTECSKGLIWNNDFSFLSSLGIGLYRSSENRIMHNNVDWCVRGYSHGKWNRGQDSAGILIYEQSNKNVFAYNSVTHGGDGFFLWAGQTTMDTGKGGCNDNLLYGNDWSHAPTNGIEATFSRNNFVNNLILECWHGIWGGYSYETKVIGNVFSLNAQAIAWEHGQDNLLAGNTFYRDLEGVSLWMNKTQDPNWGYPKNRDTRSRDWTIVDNLFTNESTNALRIRDTLNAKVLENRFLNNGRLFLLEGSNPGFQFTQNDGAAPPQDVPAGNRIVLSDANKPKPATMHGSGNVILGLDPDTKSYLNRFNVSWNPWLNGGPAPKATREVGFGEDLSKPYAPKPLVGGRNPFLKEGTLRGRRFILVDHWGPYDFKSPVLWPRGEVEDRHQVFELLGPRGSATIVDQVGCQIEAVSADGGATWKPSETSIPVPGFVRVAFGDAATIERKVTLEYRGGEVIDFRGIVTPKGKPFRFGFSQFFLPIDWTVKFFKWDAMTDPRTQHEAFMTLIGGEPLKTEKTSKLNYAGNIPEVPGDHFATVADGAFEVPAGGYFLNLTTDDGARVWVDGELVIKDAWKYQGPTLYTANLKLSAGKHTIRVEHFEIDGYSVLKVEIVKK
jgi:hypothetical protein